MGELENKELQQNEAVEPEISEGRTERKRAVI